MNNWSNWTSDPRAKPPVGEFVEMKTKSGAKVRGFITSDSPPYLLATGGDDEIESGMSVMIEWRYWNGPEDET